jgi:tRNA G46 methylase TrmB
MTFLFAENNQAIDIRVNIPAKLLRLYNRNSVPNLRIVNLNVTKIVSDTEGQMI